MFKKILEKWIFEIDSWKSKDESMKNESQNKSHPIFNKEIHIVEQSDKDFTEETYSWSKQFDSIFTDNDFIQKWSKVFNFFITIW